MRPSVHAVVSFTMGCGLLRCGWSVQYGPERHGTRLARTPVSLHDVLLHKLHHLIHYRVPHRVRHQPQARGPRRRDIPGAIVLLLTLLLLHQRLQQQRHEAGEGLRDELVHDDIRIPLVDVSVDLALLLAHTAPELKRLLPDLGHILAYGSKGELEDVANVAGQLFVVRDSNRVEALKCNLANLHIGAHACLAHDLHDIVALHLVLEVRLRELQGVVECPSRRQAHSVVLLLLAHPLYHRRQHAVDLLLLK
eukprot:scaffold7851_cov323-Prasinococcus_capsulatus_cf.AAC.2